MGTVTSTEGKTLIADDSALVPDPVTGINRKVFAGQPVPPELLEAYQEQGGKSQGVEIVKHGDLLEDETATSNAGTEFASDAAAKEAEKAGLDADEITGTGKDGAITVSDVRDAAGD